MRRALGLLAAVAVVCLTQASQSALGAGTADVRPACHNASWRMYGHDVRHSFAVRPGCTGITPANVATLLPSWFFHAKDSITASPAVSHGTVYVGSWDGTFYAINATNGKLRWSFHIVDHDAAAFGRIVSSAAVVHAGRGRHRRRVVLFGGGSSVWALDANTGRLLTHINVDPRVKTDRKKSEDSVVEVESSPVVVPAGRGRQDVYVGMDVHDEPHVGRTGLLALRLERQGHWRLQPRWKYDVETGRVYRGRAGLHHGSGHGLGCGGIWSSPAFDPSRRLVVAGTASCDYAAKAYARHRNYSEEIIALHAKTGRLAWSYRPENSLRKAQRVPAAENDADFGASPNIFTLSGHRSVVGDGSKSAKYYVRTAARGKKVSTAFAGDSGKLMSNFAVGGFIGSSAVLPGPHGTGQSIIGGTAIPIPDGVKDVSKALWDVRSINPANGHINWAYQLGAPTYGATTVANGIAFTTLTVQSDVVAINAKTGLPLWLGPLIGPPSSTAVVAGNSLYVGTGTRETDLEYKAVSDQLENALKKSIGESPLSPLSGVQAFTLAKDAV